MREARGSRGWASATALVLLTTLLGAAAPAVGQLYLQVYPGPGTEVIRPGESIEKALTKASLNTEFDAEPLTEHVRARFTATISYGKEIRARPTIKVAYANDASLKPLEGKFQITPITRTRQYLDEGTKRPGGGFQLTWMWEVVPRQSGALALQLEIQPQVVLIGSTRKDLRVRNEPIRIDVKVNPNKMALAEVSIAAKELRIAYPDRLIVGEQTEVIASLSLQGHRDAVKADIDLVRDQGSVRATIQSAGSSQGEDQVVSRWLVTPTEEGPVEMLFMVTLSAQAGDQRLTEQVPVRRSVTAEAPPPSLWSRLQAPVLWITPFVALLGAILALRSHWGGLRSHWGRLRNRWGRLRNRWRKPSRDDDATADG